MYQLNIKHSYDKLFKIIRFTLLILNMHVNAVFNFSASFFISGKSTNDTIDLYFTGRVV